MSPTPWSRGVGKCPIRGHGDGGPRKHIPRSADDTASCGVPRECLAAVTLYRLHQRTGLRRPWRLQPPSFDPRAAARRSRGPSRIGPGRPRNRGRGSRSRVRRRRTLSEPAPTDRRSRIGGPAGPRPRRDRAPVLPFYDQNLLPRLCDRLRDVWIEVVRVWALVLTAPGGLLRGDPPGRSVQVPIRLEAHPELGGGGE